MLRCTLVSEEGLLVVIPLVTLGTEERGGSVGLMAAPHVDLQLNFLAERFATVTGERQYSLVDDPNVAIA